MNCLLILSSMLINNLPPINNIYNGNVYFPLIGNQSIEYQRIAKDKSLVKLSGLIDTTGYIYNDVNNVVNYKLDKNLNNIVEKYRCTIERPYYNYEEDLILFVLKINLIRVTKKIKLVNIGKEDL